MADSPILKGLLDAASNEATLVEQYRLFKQWTSAKDVKWLAGMIKDWYKNAEWFLCDVAKRIEFLGGEVTYQAEAATTPKSISELFDQAEQMEVSIVTQYTTLAVQCMTTDLGTWNQLVHLVKRHERIIFEIRQQGALLAQLGEPGYIGSRLADG